MKELIEKLRKEADLTEDQALQSITIMKEYAKKKFPLLSGAIDKLFDKYAPEKEEDFLDY